MKTLWLVNIHLRHHEYEDKSYSETTVRLVWADSLEDIVRDDPYGHSISLDYFTASPALGG